MLEAVPVSYPSRQAIAEIVERHALLLIGVVDLESITAYARYSQWLEEGRHAEMNFLERQRESRRDPAAVLPGARRAIVLGLPYDQGDRLDSVGDRPRIAQYARFRDYHRVLWEKGDEIVASLRERFPILGSEAFRVTVDTAPLFERALAERGELGFVGKNTCDIHPEKGSFLLLAEILTTADLALDQKTPVEPTVRTSHGGCGECTACQVVCPTGALDKAYHIDARKCLAYWTIENRGPIPLEYWPWLGEYYFGCDLCQLACPFNRTAAKLPTELVPIAEPSLFEVATMGQREYEKWFGGTPLTRAKRNGLRRNALIAMVVTRDPRLSEALEIIRLDAPSPLCETLDQIVSYIPPPMQPPASR